MQPVDTYIILFIVLGTLTLFCALGTVICALDGEGAVFLMLPVTLVLLLLDWRVFQEIRGLW